MILLLFCAYLLNCNKGGKGFAAPSCSREEEDKKNLMGGIRYSAVNA